MTTFLPLPHLRKVEHFSPETLIQKIRKVTLLLEPQHFPYQEAQIELCPLTTQEISPPQRYVLPEQLRLIQELRFQLQDWGYELFELQGYLQLWFEGQENPIGLIPPIIEQSIEHDHSRHWIICDGMHRCYLARTSFYIPQVLKITGITTPYYAYPNLKGWDDVQILYEAPPSFIKKFHRLKDNKKLYRNFVPEFGNLSIPRGNL
jgi:hypothetical protein